jgi:hypothetical protein
VNLPDDVSPGHRFFWIEDDPEGVELSTCGKTLPNSEWICNRGTAHERYCWFCFDHEGGVCDCPVIEEDEDDE